MSTQTDLIRKIDFFEPLDQKIIKKIGEVCIAREYSSGDYIVKQGECGLGLFFIVKGLVKVEIDRGGAKVEVALLKAEDVLGELSIIDDKPRSANVICLEDTSCLLLTRDSFSKLMNKHPEIAIQMAKTLAGRIRTTNERMGEPPGTLPAPAPPASSPEPQAAGTPPVTAADSSSPPSAASAQPSQNVPEKGPPAKNKVMDFLVDTFSSLYTLKALTRFSVAVIGCPVSVHPEKPASEVLQATIGEVKLTMFPASEDCVLGIYGFDDGSFSATVLHPDPTGGSAAVTISRIGYWFGRNERLRLHIPKCWPAWLERPLAGPRR